MRALVLKWLWRRKKKLGRGYGFPRLEYLNKENPPEQKSGSRKTRYDIFKVELQSRREAVLQLSSFNCDGMKDSQMVISQKKTPTIGETEREINNVKKVIKTFWYVPETW